MPLLLIKPGRTVEEVGQGAHREGQAVGGKMASEEVEAAPIFPADQIRYVLSLSFVSLAAGRVLATF